MDYIVKGKDFFRRYFYSEDNGILVSKKEGVYHNEPVFPDGKEEFSLVREGDKTDVVCINKKNELVYLSRVDNQYKMHILCRIPREFVINKIMVSFSRGFKNLVFSARYKGENHLIHCILGNYAKPSVIDRMDTEYFYIFKGKIYYQNKNFIMGYQDLSDGKPEQFTPLAEGAHFPYLCSFNGRDYITYIKDNKIYVNNKVKATDPYAETPIIRNKNDKPCLLWKSGEILKYLPLYKEDVFPRPIISTKTQKLCAIYDENGFYYDYV